MMKEILLFQTCGRKFAIDMPLVYTIIRADQIPRPAALEEKIHNLTVNDLNISVLEFDQILEPGCEYSDMDSRKIIITKTKHNVFALRVDKVDQVVTVGEKNVEPLPPVFRGAAKNCFSRVLKLNNGLIPMVDPEGTAATFQNVTEDRNQ
jgi:chemotaxis signal transduction protein